MLGCHWSRSSGSCYASNLKYAIKNQLFSSKGPITIISPIIGASWFFMTSDCWRSKTSEQSSTSSRTTLDYYWSTFSPSQTRRTPDASWESPGSWEHWCSWERTGGKPGVFPIFDIYRVDIWCLSPALETPAAPGLSWKTEERIFTTGRSPSRETFYIVHLSLGTTTISVVTWEVSKEANSLQKA